MDSLDTRYFQLTYEPPALFIEEESISLTQREIRLIMKHTEGRNAHIYNKLKEFIERVDKKEGRKTDFNERVPKTHVVRFL